MSAALRPDRLSKFLVVLYPREEPHDRKTEYPGGEDWQL